MTLANLVSYSAQVAILVAICAALPRALGLRSPGLQYAFWRVLLVVCLLLPIVEPWRHEEMVFVPAPSGPGSPTALTRGAIVPPDIGPPLGAMVTTGVEVLILAGISGRLAWLSLGVFRLRRMRRRAADPADGFADLQQTIGTAADIRWSPDVHHPVTFGILQPVILLPVPLATTDTGAQRAVIAHELHHVRRRDWAWVVAEEIVRSVFWFHPAIWWLVSRVQLARETVVDELSILTTNARRAYLDTLLAFADDTGLSSTPAFSARRHLFHRVMLLSREVSMSSLRITVGSCVLVFALGAGAWGAVSAFPLSSTSVVSDDTITGNSTTQGADTLLPAPPAQQPPGATRTTPGQLAPPPPPSQSTGKMPPPPPPPPAQGAKMPDSFRETMERLHPIRVGGNMKQPAKIHDVRPAYPDDAMAAGVQGTVSVEAIVDSTGHVADARIVDSIPMLDEAALKAVSQWEFEPTLLNGDPTAIVFMVTVHFTLQ